MLVCKEDASSEITPFEVLVEKVSSVCTAAGVGGMMLTCGQYTAFAMF
jgi:hypothetical protein